MHTVDGRGAERDPAVRASEQGRSEAGDRAPAGVAIAVPRGLMSVRIAGVPVPVRLLRQLRQVKRDLGAVFVCADPAECDAAVAAVAAERVVTVTVEGFAALSDAPGPWICLPGDLVVSGEGMAAALAGPVSGGCEAGWWLDGEAVAGWADGVANGGAAPSEARPFVLPPQAVAVRVDDPAQARRTERALRRALGRPQDPNVTRLTGRRLSSPISLRLATSGVPANAVTLAGMAVGLVAAALIAAGGYWWTLAGALTLVASRLLDDCDGEVARLTVTQSRLGERLDITSDILVHSAAFLALAWSAQRADPDGDHLLAFALLLFGGAVSTVLVLGWVSGSRRPEESRLLRLMETSASGDFAYVLLAFAGLGLAPWFLWIAAVGAQGFWLLLAYLIWRSRPPRRPAAAMAVGWSRYAELGLFAGGVGLLGALIWQTGWAGLLADLSLVGWGFVLICLVEAIPVLACAAGWMVTIAPAARTISFLRLLAARLAGDSINHLTPTATLGGEFVRARLVVEPLGVAESTSSVTLAKFAETAGQVVFIVVGLLAVLPALHPLGSVRWWLLAVVGAGAVGIALLARMLDRGFFAFAARQLSRLGVAATWFRRHGDAIASIDGLVRDAMRQRPVDVARSVAWYTIAFAASVVEVWLALYFLGVPVSWSAALGIEVLSVLIDAVFFFMPAKMGTQEGGKMLAFTLFGLPAEKGLAMGLIRRGRELFWDAVGLAAFAALRSGASPPRPAAPPPGPAAAREGARAEGVGRRPIELSPGPAGEPR